MSALKEVQGRINAIENAPLGIPGRGIENTLGSVIRVMGSVTNGYIAGKYSEPLVGDTKILDALLQESVVISHLSEDLPALATGPLDQLRQAWMATPSAPQPLSGLKRQPKLVRDEFLQVHRQNTKLATKPVEGGLYTSTIVPQIGKSMWRMYVEAYGGSLFPHPWNIYLLELVDDIRVFEVTSAGRWVTLVDANHIKSNGLIYPDWEAISDKYDAIHMTIPAIVAMQGVRITTPQGIIAETYWDIESTLWLNWCINSAIFTENIPPSPQECL